MENDEIVEADESPNPVVIDDEDESPYHSFVQDTGNEPLEVDRLHRAFAWSDAEPQPIKEFETHSIAAMASVKLFPLGFADPTKPDRQFRIRD